MTPRSPASRREGRGGKCTTTRSPSSPTAVAGEDRARGAPVVWDEVRALRSRAADHPPSASRRLTADDRFRRHQQRRRAQGDRGAARKSRGDSTALRSWRNANHGSPDELHGRSSGRQGRVWTATQSGGRLVAAACEEAGVPLANGDATATWRRVVRVRDVAPAHPGEASPCRWRAALGLLAGRGERAFRALRRGPDLDLVAL